jgi:hypothetical protein
MSEEPVKHGENGGFEHEDLGARSVLIFLGILAAICVLVYFAMGGVYSYLDAYNRAHQPAQNPLKPRPEAMVRDEHAEQVYKHIVRTFPQPRLERDERTELRDFRMREEQALDSYGWVDEKDGVVHIPIERAMQLMAQRGLPVFPQSETGSAKTEKGMSKEHTKP